MSKQTITVTENEGTPYEKTTTRLITDRDRIARIFTKMSAKNNLLGYNEKKYMPDELLEKYYQHQNEAITEILELLNQSRVDELLEIKYATIEKGDEYLNLLLTERIRAINDRTS